MIINDIKAMGGKLSGIDTTALEKYISMAEDEIYLYLSDSCSGFINKITKTAEKVSGDSVNGKRVISATKKTTTTEVNDGCYHGSVPYSNRFGKLNRCNPRHAEQYSRCSNSCANLSQTDSVSCDYFTITDDKIYFDTSDAYTISYIDTGSLMLPNEFKTLYSDLAYRNFLVECKSMTDMTAVANVEQFIARGFDKLKSYLKNKGCCGPNTTTTYINTFYLT